MRTGREPQSQTEAAPAFSRPLFQGDDDEFSVLLKLIETFDESRAYPRSDKTTLEDVAKEVARDVYPHIEVEDTTRAATAAAGGRTFAIKLGRAGRPVRSNGDATVRQYRNGTLELDVSRLNPGEDGSLIYQIVGDYAHNAGLVFQGDRYGLSHIAQIRRTENMLSSAVRWGATAHLHPHDLQLDPEVAGVRKLNWKVGEDAHNLRELAKTAAETTLRLVPELTGVTYNFDTGQFEKRGNVFPDAKFDRLGRRVARLRPLFLTSGAGAGGTAPVGRRTLKRAVYLTSLAREAALPGWRRLLARLSGERPESSGTGAAAAGVVPPKIFYSSPPTTPPPRSPQQPLFDDGFDLPSETLFDYLVRNLQDRFRRVKILQRAIVQQGGRVTPEMDAYLKEEIFHGKVAAALEDFERDQVEPLVKAMGRAGVTMTALDDYLYARHAPERNEYIASIRRDMPDGGSGMTNAEAAEYMAGLGATERTILVGF